MSWTPAEIVFIVGLFCAGTLALFSIAALSGLAMLRWTPWLIPTWVARILAEEGYDRRRRPRRVVLGVVPGCGECRWAHDAGDATLARHLATFHGVIAFDRRAA